MWVLLATALGAATGCAVEGADDEVSRSESLARFSGQDLFVGIFFMDGPVAQRLPELVEDIRVQGGAPEDDAELEKLRSQFPPPTEVEGERRAEIDRFEQRVLALVEAADPTFFARFAEDLQSGDHFRVDAALTEGSEVLEAALAADLGVSSEELRKNPDQYRCFDWVVPGYIIDYVWVVPPGPVYVYYWY
jgi:SdpC family antimicrobial peptide